MMLGIFQKLKNEPHWGWAVKISKYSKIWKWDNNNEIHKNQRKILKIFLIGTILMINFKFDFVISVLK